MALVTGAANGIGRDFCTKLAKDGVPVTLVDVDIDSARIVASSINSTSGKAQAVHCDVATSEDLNAAFESHIQAFGDLQYVLLNAGISESGDLIKGSENEWKKTLEVDFIAVAVGVRLAVKHVQKPGGVIMITASAGGVYPMPLSPIYSASKAACVHLTRCLAEPLMREYGVRICALCPQFVDTNLVRSLDDSTQRKLLSGTRGRILSVEQITEAGLFLLRDSAQIGTCLAVLSTGEWALPSPPRFVRTEQQRTQKLGIISQRPPYYDWATRLSLPATFQKWQIMQLSRDFVKAASLMSQPILPITLPPGCILMRRLFVGINASDVNYSAGLYHKNKAAALDALPFGAGFESVGVIVKTSTENDSNRHNHNRHSSAIRVGDAVATMEYGGFSEFAVLKERQLLPIPKPNPETLALLTSGLTASISLAGKLKPGQTVLVTAAAGGTGQFAVQLAKQAGCRVIATCSGGMKQQVLERLGADVIINYKESDLHQALKVAAPKGIDVVYESVGGETFKAALDALAVGGRIIIIGMMSQYGAGWQPTLLTGLPEKLLWKGAALEGFFLVQHTNVWRRHLDTLIHQVENGTLAVELEMRKKFIGIEKVPDAIEWLQSGQSQGKVYVQLMSDSELPPDIFSTARPKL